MTRTDRLSRLRDEREYDGRRAGSAELFVALAFPNRYSVGMSSVGFQTILARIRRSGRFAAERVFLPEGEEGPLRTFESGRPVGGADVLAFSISFENDYVHFLRLLRAARVPLRREEREERHPIVLVGGACTFLNPEPLRPFVDLFLLGDGEEAVEEYLDARLEDRGLPRAEHLARAAAIEGAYVPSVHPRSGDRARRSYEGHTSDPALSRILTPHAEFPSTLLVEISRGCPRRCRFCTVGTAFPKFRAVPADVVVDVAERFRAEDSLLGREPLRKIGLVTAAFFDHREAEAMTERLSRKGFLVTASSVRVDQLTDPVLHALVQSGSRTLTIAPEAGTERMRALIQKKASDEVILDGVERAARAGFRNLRAYFMVGLPFETEEDRLGIVGLARRVRERFRSAGRGPGAGAGRVTISLHPFVPKPLTPFQWSRMLPPAEMKRILASLRSKLGGFTVKAPDLRDVYTEGILALGGEELEPFLVRLADGERWDRAARAAGLDLGATLFAERPPDERVAWAGRALDRTETSNRREWERAAAYR
ncbi:MAG: radical SAM protein [Candidatus Latescibacterota bacterium]|nr:MAG: radical SAM protein [Candidatus Latescibacterota bacterium]